ncbi:DUF3127 domain-containing protein [Rhabdobacter roseus]|uniref:DUF3127 domain-containing protein n=1 Tax=Rhabdobacter roseus TaxID=1655419 RepID=A0A840TT52_9BACT|nr:DUF3127 domain-containing protein [Rhabdobacter roseus]MBB5284742.1 hypothetical protein [Rhabdobacter roseus]
MELTGAVISLLPEVSGQGKNGTWRKQEFVLEIPAQYPRKVCITMWGDKIDQFNLKVGDSVTASIDIESREYNGRWYTEVKAWKVEKAGSTPAGASSEPNFPPVTTFSEEDSDDLPF